MTNRITLNTPSTFKEALKQSAVYVEHLNFSAVLHSKIPYPGADFRLWDATDKVLIRIICELGGGSVHVYNLSALENNQ